MSDLATRFKRAREQSWQRFGKSITFYLPGMFIHDGRKGAYPAASITGDRCTLQCDHCKGKILGNMLPTDDPQKLVDTALRMAGQGHKGILISGGCDDNGALPWRRFTGAIEKIKAQTNLFVSIHSGLINTADAMQLEAAGVDQALIDVVGDDDTLRKIYHVPFGVDRIRNSMNALQEAGISIIPHIVCELDYGKIKGERRAIAMVSRFNVPQLVIVSLMGIPGTPTHNTVKPPPHEVAEIIMEARRQLPDTVISLGCARQRGERELEILAIDAGINRMALPSDEAIERARQHGLAIRYQMTCCSVSHDFSTRNWPPSAA